MGLEIGLKQKVITHQYIQHKDINTVPVRKSNNLAMLESCLASTTHKTHRVATGQRPLGFGPRVLPARLLGRLVVFLGHLQELVLDRFPFAVGLAGDLAEDLVAELTFVPAFGPTQPVEKAVEFRLAQAGSGRSQQLLVPSFLV